MTQLTQVQQTLVEDAGFKNVVYLAVTWRRIAFGGGLIVDRIQLSVNAEGEWEQQCVAGKTIRILNDATDEILWQKDNCDVSKPGYNHEYGVGIKYPGVKNIRVRWAGNANINNAPDKDFVLQAGFSY